MKAIVLLTFNLLVCLAAYSQNAADETQIRALVKQTEDAWNKQDFSLFKSEIYAPESMFINPLGEYWNGQPEIVKGIDAVSESILKNLSAKYTVKDIQFLAPTVALVVMHVVSNVKQDFNNPDGSRGGAKGDTNQSMTSLVFVKVNNAWKITATQITPITPMPGITRPTAKLR